MTITWKDPNMRLHGKKHKSDGFYFRWHYGKQRVVAFSHQYIDKPTENQKTAREQFTTLRREVARQLKEPKQKAKWERKFKQDPQGYKMLHTYVYAMMKKEQNERTNSTEKETCITRISAPNISIIIIPIGETFVPITLTHRTRGTPHYPLKEQIHSTL